MDGYEIVGWQRNVSRLQKFDVSLPTIIYIKLDNSLTIREISLDGSFMGSKGLLCNHKYLNVNMKKCLMGMTIDDLFFKHITVENMHCFHITEVMSGILSCLDILAERRIAFLFEQEVLDGYVNGDDLCFVGLHSFSFKEKPARYHAVFKGAFKNVKFNEVGTIFSTEIIPATFYVDGYEVYTSSISGNSSTRICVNIKSFIITGLAAIKKEFTNDLGNSYMCSNLFPQAFIGLFVQSIAMKMFHNNYSFILHILNSIQRNNDVPRCIGSVISFDESKKYFPNYNIEEVFI